VGHDSVFFLFITFLRPNPRLGTGWVCLQPQGRTAWPNWSPSHIRHGTSRALPPFLPLRLLSTSFSSAPSLSPAFAFHFIFFCSFRFPLFPFFGYKDVQWNLELAFSGIHRSTSVVPEQILFCKFSGSSPRWLWRMPSSGMQAISSCESSVLTRAAEPNIPEDGILQIPFL
jgi:hypothetical protein